MHIRFEPINERICNMRIKGKFYNMTIVSVYAPTEDENKQKLKRWNNCIIICQMYVTKHRDMMP